MVNPSREFYACCAVLVLAGLILTATAQLRSAEYDEQYTLFLTAGTPRPDWPDGVFSADLIVEMQSGHAGLAEIAQDLRRTDVHPPLYFWAAALWRRIAGQGLFAARLLSVGFSLVGLAAVGRIAGRINLPPALAMLLTLGCYGFAYTGCNARGFALAQMLNLLGVAVTIGPWPRRAVLAGGAFGAALFTNYLAVFVGLAVMSVKVLARPFDGPGSRILASQMAGFIPFLLASLWFFAAQRTSRTGQFPPFQVASSIARLARYGAANLGGGLPLYVPASSRGLVTVGLAIAIASLGGLIAWRFRRIATPSSRRLLLVAAGASPAGLVALGVVFNNTPIELRYLAFATPFIALLLAGAIRSLPPTKRRLALTGVLTLQTLAIAGLMVRPETMQPARATAAAAATIARGGPVLLPRGNDGVGIVGAFAIEAPPALSLLVISADEPVSRIRARAGQFPRVVLAEMAQDDASRTAIATMRQAFSDPGWRAVAHGFNVVAYQRIRQGN